MAKSKLKAVVAGIVCLTALVAGPTAAQAAEAQQPMTLDEAVTRALAHSRSLKGAGLEAERAFELREKAGEQLSFTPVAGQMYSPEIDRAWYGLLTADLTWRMSEKTEALKEDQVALEVARLYWRVQTALDQLGAAQVAYDAASLAARHAQLGYQVGVRSKLELETAQAKAEQAKAALEEARHGVAAAYQVFNQAVGLALDERPLLLEEPRFAPLEVQDLEAEVRRVLADSPAVWLSEQKVTLQKYALDMPFADGLYKPYRVRQIELQQAELNAADAREQTANLVRSLYTQVKTLEETYRKTLAQANLAKEQYRVTLIKQSLGMATQAEVLDAEAVLAQARTAVKALLDQHSYYKMAFQKPWALSGGPASSGSAQQGAGASGP